MKCDELRVYKVYTTRNEGAFGFCECADPTDIELEHETVCLKSEVDAAIAELKEALNEAESSRYEAGADAADYYQENRRLKRALWLARANRAIEKIAWFKLWNGSISTMNPEDGARQEFDKWKKNLGKFLSKAEEYK